LHVFPPEKGQARGSHRAEVGSRSNKDFVAHIKRVYDEQEESALVNAPYAVTENKDERQQQTGDSDPYLGEVDLGSKPDHPFKSRNFFQGVS
jgi:hypothetical protein